MKYIWIALIVFLLSGNIAEELAILSDYEVYAPKKYSKDTYGAALYINIILTGIGFYLLINKREDNT